MVRPGVPNATASRPTGNVNRRYENFMAASTTPVEDAAAHPKNVANPTAIAAGVEPNQVASPASGGLCGCCVDATVAWMDGVDGPMERKNRHKGQGESVPSPSCKVRPVRGASDDPPRPAAVAIPNHDMRGPGIWAPTHHLCPPCIHHTRGSIELTANGEATPTDGRGGRGRWGPWQGLPGPGTAPHRADEM